MTTPNLTREQANLRKSLIRVQSYDVHLDFTDGLGNLSTDTFRSATTIVFAADSPSATTWLDLVAYDITTATLNGEALDVSRYRPETGIVLPKLQRSNTVTVEARIRYSNTGEGIHLFVDPLDNETYLYSHFQATDAKRAFACFDQPDIKAPYTFHITAPEHWEVASNSPISRIEARHTGGKTVHFDPTLPISSYLTAVVAGPYHVCRTVHDGIDLALYCRRTLAKDLDADRILDVTKKGLDWYNKEFGHRYPFGKYDQIFAPELNVNAMENVGAVTLSEDFVFHGQVTDAQYQNRANVILHEMAHMWFGNLVTMRWWSDLWLNESFATYAASLCQASATRWSDAWVTFASKKAVAYEQDLQPTAHPVATDSPDEQAAAVNYDGITYAKGASVLKQLVAQVGLEAFMTGLRHYFATFAYGNTDLAALLSILEEASGRDLSGWATVWLETAGVNTMRVEYQVDEAGRYTAFELIQEAPTDVVRSNTLRPHRLEIALYNSDGERLVRTDRVDVDVTGARIAVPKLIGALQPDALLVNDDDLTYGKPRLDRQTLATLRDGGIARIDDPMARALFWSSAWEMTRDGIVAARDFVTLVLAGASGENDIGVLQLLMHQAQTALDIYATRDWAPTGYGAMARYAYAALRGAKAGSDQQIVWARVLTSCAGDDRHLDFIQGLWRGTEQVAGLVIDDSLRWSIVQTLAGHGLVNDADIRAELDRDPSASAHRNAATAYALLPTPQAKAEAWYRSVEDGALQKAMRQAFARGFAHRNQGEILAPYIDRYFDEVPELWRRSEGETGQKLVKALFPRWASAIDANTLATADRLLAREGLPTALVRLIGEGRADVSRALRARATDAGCGTGAQEQMS
ncbi:aminopeptidase N [Saccharopolyspora phatthalungensis]|uniref:Aminopeptidase N n=1 Tax=Saccharopolyspora phatthalungensis TaxID=664693 RepID=A0A840QK81_9PSEU|nr:aminopeptidase N [Saccharopolyspora phatthalungensis]MBB5159809.1 aminopeptidase N [Saccharopolyspora phatthalungensis]